MLACMVRLPSPAKAICRLRSQENRKLALLPKKLYQERSMVQPQTKAEGLRASWRTPGQ